MHGARIQISLCSQDKKLGELPEYKNLLTTFNTHEIVRWPEFHQTYQAEITAQADVFNGKYLGWGCLLVMHACRSWVLWVVVAERWAASVGHCSNGLQKAKRRHTVDLVPHPLHLGLVAHETDCSQVKQNIDLLVYETELSAFSQTPSGWRT